MKKYSPLIVFAFTCVTVTFIIAFVSGSQKNNENFSDEELFKEFLQDPIPESVEVIRVHRPNTVRNPIYVFSFKVKGEDFETIRKVKPFVLIDPNKEESFRFNPSNTESVVAKHHPWKWKFDASSGRLSWTTPHDVKALRPGVQLHTIYLGNNELSQIEPNWFKLDRWREAQFYAYEGNRDSNNLRLYNDHILIYNKRFSEAYYIRKVHSEF